MGIKMIVIAFAFELFLFNCIKCEELPRKTLKLKQDSDLDKQFKISNKPSVKTIQYFGDLYDCVDFYKQPAFDNPLLKNHKYEYKMSSKSFPTGIVGLPDGGCPMGTVPIRRITKENYSQNYRILEEGDAVYRPVVRTTSPKDKKHYGGKTTMSVYAPKVSPTQRSSALMALGNDNETMEAGWMVNPSAYGGDTRPRLYVYTHTKSSSCYDSSCGQFVQVNPDIPLGLVLQPVSTINGSIYDIDVYIHRMELIGQWWLAFGKNEVKIGYWPREVFATELADAAEYVEWGGEAKCTRGESGPEMGSGLFPSKDIKQEAYCVNITTVNDARQLEDPEHTVGFEVYEEAYSVQEYYDVGNIKHLVMFGGPGPKA